MHKYIPFVALHLHMTLAVYICHMAANEGMGTWTSGMLATPVPLLAWISQHFMNSAWAGSRRIVVVPKKKQSPV